MTILRKLIGTGISGISAQAIAGTVGGGKIATGTNQATAFLLSEDMTIFSTVASGTGGILPSGAAANDLYTTVNNGANALSIYPPVGGSFDAGAANTAYSVPPNGTANFKSIGSNNFIVEVTAADLSGTGGAGVIGFIQSGTGAVLRTVQAKITEIPSVEDFGAVGNGVTDDTSSFQNAALLGSPIFVPNTSSFYAVTALTSSEIELLWGPGIIKIAGVVTPIPSLPTIRNNNAPASYVSKATLAPATNTTNGSVGFGASDSQVTRSGGYGQYGNHLKRCIVSAAVPSTQFDSNDTTWISATNLTGGQIFSGWDGANTPSANLSQTYSGGGVIGREINAGNRWADFGLQVDVGGTRYTAGLQIVPDVVPSSDGVNSKAVTISVASPAVVSLTAHGFTANMGVVFNGAGTIPTGLVAGATNYVSATGLTADTFQVSATAGGASINTTGSFVAPVSVLPSYPGSFSSVTAASIHGHQWWVGELIRQNSLCAGGHAKYVNGGANALVAPLDAYNVQGYWTNGIDLASATFSSTIAIKLAAAHAIYFGAAAISGGSTGALGLSPAGTNTGTLYSNGFGSANFKWGYSGSAATLGFFGATPIVKPSSYGTPTNVSKISSFSGTAATLADTGGTLAALITDLKSLGIIGA
jgi:hypothetical protein